MNRARLERRHDRQVLRHLRWVVARSPWTARRFADAGLDLRRWRELPTVGKAEMMANFDELNTVGVRLADVLALARDAERTRDFSATLPGTRGPVTVGLSTGTSGAQGAFVVDRRDRMSWAVVALRSCLPRWPWDLVRRHRVAFFLRAEGGLYRSVQTPLLRFEFFDILRPVEGLAASLTEYRPTLLVGPPSVLRAVAAAGARADVERVVSVAEVLEPDDRALLAEAFGPVVEVYQATEGMLGIPCREGNLHLNEAHVHVDLEPLGDGRFAPVVTDLRRRAQPMVRHRLDDVLVIGDACPCGSPHRRILRIEGRCDDALVLAGKTIWPDFVRAALAAVPGLEEYAVEQRGDAELVVRLLPADARTGALARDALARMLGRLGPDPASVAITLEPWAPPPPGSKRRRVTRGRTTT